MILDVFLDIANYLLQVQSGRNNFTGSYNFSWELKGKEVKLV
jgi:hypothetical protein